MISKILATIQKMKPDMMGIINMTEQLEIIRRRFEALHPVPECLQWASGAYILPMSEPAYYLDKCQQYNFMWQGFLSCMSQEIKLPPWEQLWDSHDVPLNEPAYRHNELVADLEAHGYRVKR